MNRIKDLRISFGYKQSTIAQKLNMTQPSYSALENGRTQASADILIALADIYQVSIDFLLGRTNISGDNSGNQQIACRNSTINASTSNFSNSELSELDIALLDQFHKLDIYQKWSLSKH